MCETTSRTRETAQSSPETELKISKEKLVGCAVYQKHSQRDQNDLNIYITVVGQAH